MKKFVLLTLSIALALTFVGCSNNSKDSQFNVSVTDPDGNPTPAPTTISAGRNINVDLVQITDDEINIRSGAGTSNAILGQANSDEYFLLLKEGDSWNKISYKNQDAFVYSDYCVKSEMNILEAQKLLKNQVLKETTGETADNAQDADSTTGEDVDMSQTEDGQAAREN